MSDLKQKSRLGRGLSSLISVPAESAPPAESAANSNLTEIPLDQIAPNPHQPRRTINQAAIAELAASLKSSGVIQPIIVRRTVGGVGGFELIAGERRLRAAKHAGLASIPAVIRDVDRATQAQMALVENIQREDLNPIDRAAGYRSMIELLALTQSELAIRLGEDRSTIANHLRLLDLPESVRQLIKDGTLQLGHAKLLAGLPDPAEQNRLATLVAAKDLSVRALEQLMQARPAAAKNARPAPSPAYLNDLEKSLSRQLGLRVAVKASGKGKGRLVVHYSTLDEFDQLMKILGVKAED